MNRQVILDTETTGLDVSRNHKIIEIGCIEIIDRKYTGKKFHEYLNPKRQIDQGALSVHGITNEFLEDKPLFEDIKDSLLNFIKGSELISVIDIENGVNPSDKIKVEIKYSSGEIKKIETLCRIDTKNELEYYKNGGILQYVLRNMI